MSMWVDSTIEYIIYNENYFCTGPRERQEKPIETHLIS